ncbi:flagellar type III secretion system protein FlhB [Pseudomethylobacillus aquaticus]|uniref:Flagellar biosynthetic protein FlhB n=1 Tax=Pseudomethylobacillus aquaticus TaxID=2676064 RepID=A0A3N0V0P1_9PROT|nr:flagellar biosynthesis protein FlhB [Pseudomethylobacillus aquaticus]ROH86367.1 flagellar type III secretion system protein FlhB [Pseudomethylobacillus aquaticus]
MAEDSDLEKTEPASPKRIEKAREDGDVPRSRELATCAVLLASGLAFWGLAGQMNEALKLNMTLGLRFTREEIFDPAQFLLHLVDRIADLLLAFAPLGLIVLLVAIASPVFIGGWNMSAKALMPKFSRLNPISGFGNLFSKNSLVELIKAVAKSVLVGTVAYLVIVADLDEMLGLAMLPLDEGIGYMESLLFKSTMAIVGALVLIAMIDVPYQLHHYANKLKMTKQDLRQESKESEGNPEVKARIRQQQREMARRRMMSEIPNADVVITNPTHYAVAIQYKEDGMRAPVLLAKGADAVALKIREIAAEHHLPVLESPKLARALYAHTELGDEIPEALYAAVAEVLAYVYQLRVYHSHGGQQPQQPEALDVPDALDPHLQTSPINLMPV